MRLKRSIYSVLPRDGRRRLSALLHGETPTQKRLAERVRAVTSHAGAPGYGESLSGSPLRPHRAQIVTEFDVHGHLDGMRETLTAVLTDAGVPVYTLPHERPALLVVSSRLWKDAWLALSADPRCQGLWVGASDDKDTPVTGVSKAPEHPTARIFRHLVAPDGSTVADERFHVRLQRWAEVGPKGEPRVDGGRHREGTLLRADAEPNGFASELSPDVLESLLPGAPATWLPGVDAVVEPVDLVYTWVDGADPAWLLKRSAWEGGGFTSDAQVESRFVSHDELRYSLRSVEMYANWFHRLYLVTDGQVPGWLNVDHPRLTVVDHRDIFDADELPVFNSHAIESRLHRIPGLAERFIYLNDDVFFAGPVRPEDFYTGAGQLKYFPSKATIDPAPGRPDDVSVTSAAKNNRSLLERALGRTITTKLKHTPHAQLTSLLTEMEERFPEVFDGNVAARFRSHDDHSVVSGLAQRYGAAVGKAVEGFIAYNYADISRPDIERVLAKWKRGREFSVFCLNDTGTALGDESARVFDEFLQTYFPVASSFEVE